MKARIVTIDVENMANLLWSWQVHSFRGSWQAIETEFDWHLLCFAAKWYGQKTQVFSLNQYEGYIPMLERLENGTLIITPPDERKLLEDLWKILDEADIVVGWNSKRFDVKKIQSKMIALGMAPPSPFKQIDVMQEKKKLTASNSNKLDDTGQEWHLGRKLKHQGFPLWLGCCEGDPKAWRKMRRYNIIDVNLTEKAYKYLRPWMVTHPNLNVYSGQTMACPACQKTTAVIKRGFWTTPTRRRQRYQCAPHRGGCGRFFGGLLLPVEPNKKIIAR